MSRDLLWLNQSFRALDRVYFGDSVSIEGFKVRWMRWRPNKKSFIFGLCDKEKKIILINRALQHDWVPDFVVLSTLYHEMLHIVIGDDHDMAFELAESKFIHNTSAQVWEESHLTKLINCERPKLIQ
jgi:Zn-dependent peptidase ImmA (M78 family)